MNKIKALSLYQRLLHKIGVHFQKGALGLVKINKRWFLLFGEKVVSVTCIVCGKTIYNPFLKLKNKKQTDLDRIANNIKNMGKPNNNDNIKTIAKARKLATIHLNKLGYSHRQIMRALGLRSPQSITQYLKSENIDCATGGTDE